MRGSKNTRQRRGQKVKLTAVGKGKDSKACLYSLRLTLVLEHGALSTFGGRRSHVFLTAHLSYVQSCTCAL